MQLTWSFLTLSLVAFSAQAGALHHGSAALDRSSLSADRAPRALSLRLASPALFPRQGPSAGTATTVVSRFRLTVPHPDAELLYDAEQTKTPSGFNRDWVTPPLAPGRTYQYVFTAKWRPNNYTVMTRKKTVQFKAGDAVVVDLTGDDPADRAEIRYVPTPDFIVDEMIKVAGVTRDDVVYEPGCGDARVTIAAVKAGARRGVGIDLDAVRVAESRKQVSAAGLQSRIEIRQGDALDIKDLSDATVVFLYMGDEFDVLLRPVLWKQLRVGARIVSHRFRMGDWMPDETITVARPTDDEVSLVHVWTITKEVKARARRPWPRASRVAARHRAAPSPRPAAIARRWPGRTLPRVDSRSRRAGRCHQSGDRDPRRPGTALARPDRAPGSARATREGRRHRRAAGRRLPRPAIRRRS